MDALRLYDEFSDPSAELMDASLLRATTIWREDIHHHLSHPMMNRVPILAWEAVSAHRSTKEVSEDEESGKDMHAAFTNVRATTESYDRFFPLEPISAGTDLLDYIKSFSLSTAKNVKQFELILSEEERQSIVSAHSLSPEYVNKAFVGTRIIDHYTSRRISVDQMSSAKIRNDLDYMWRHRMYSDVQVVVPSTRHNREDDEERMVAVFSCHRWVLMARSPYFWDELSLSGPKAETRRSLTSYPVPSSPKADSTTPNDLTVVPLPSPPFNPITVDFTLRFLYTGSLQPPNQRFATDRATAFSLYRAALFLSIPSLKDLIVAHMVSDMMHGCFSASVLDDEFSEMTGGLWKHMTRKEGEEWGEDKGGCKCRQCSRRAPRMLHFSLEPDIKDALLERGARRALVGLFGPGWCTQELGSLSDNLHDLILEDLQDVITPRNALSLLFAAEEAFERLGRSPTFWDRPIRRMIEAARKRVEEVICQQSRPSFFCDEWKEIIENPARGRLGAGEIEKLNKESKKKLQWIVDAVRRSMQPQNAGPLYQTLTWFTDAQVPPEKQNKLLSETIGALIDQLRQEMLESRAPSILSSASSIFETIDPSHRAALDALDLSSTSDLGSGWTVYSHPSSRTKSTDYGFFYTRMAISQETIETMTIRRRNSWDSMSVYNGS